MLLVDDLSAVELPNVCDPEFAHDQAIKAHAEGKTSIDLGVDAAGFEGVVMNHATAENLNETAIFADLAA